MKGFVPRFVWGGGGGAESLKWRPLCGGALRNAREGNYEPKRSVQTIGTKSKGG